MSTPTNVAVTASHRTIDDHIVRTIGIFQALVALPTAVFLGIWTFIQLIDPYENFSNAYYYYFFTDFFTTLMAAGIIFIVLVQHRAELDTYKTFVAEASKSILATGLWLWLLMDSLFGPWQSHYGDRDAIRRMKRARLVRSVTAVILLLLFFYSAFVYIFMKLTNEKRESVNRGARNQEHRATVEGERQPLLLP